MGAALGQRIPKPAVPPTDGRVLPEGEGRNLRGAPAGTSSSGRMRERNSGRLRPNSV
jgi:hypothetical protein